MKDDWYVPPGVCEDEIAKRKARPGATIHFHHFGEVCIEEVVGKLSDAGLEPEERVGHGCYGVVVNESARTVDGTIVGTGL